MTQTEIFLLAFSLQDRTTQTSLVQGNAKHTVIKVTEAKRRVVKKVVWR